MIFWYYSHLLAKFVLLVWWILGQRLCDKNSPTQKRGWKSHGHYQAKLHARFLYEQISQK